MLGSESKKIEARGETEITRGLARFVVETGFRDLPSEVIEAAKKAFLDCFGVTIAGALEPVGELIRSLVKEMEARPVAGVLGNRKQKQSGSPGDG